MKRTLLTLGLLVGFGIGGGAWVSAQTAPAPKRAATTTRPLPRARPPPPAAWASLGGRDDAQRHAWAAAWG